MSDFHEAGEARGALLEEAIYRRSYSCMGYSKNTLSILLDGALLSLRLTLTTTPDYHP